MKNEFDFEECVQFSSKIFGLVLWESSQRMVEMFQTVNELTEDTDTKRKRTEKINKRKKKAADEKMY